MEFSKLPDNRGMIYAPDIVEEKKKNSCRDCFSCQWCGNERCRVCRHGKTLTKARQVRTYKK